MSEFVLVFRRDYKTEEVQPTPAQYQVHLKHWQQWYASLAESDMLARQVQRLDTVGKVVAKGLTVSSGPYSEVRESVGGLVFVKANDYNEAEEIAESCPILEFGGSVEVREIL